MTSRSPVRPPLAALLVLAALLASTARPSAAAPGDRAWERGIPAGVAAQDQEIARSSAGAVVRRLESRVSREADVVTLYLLGRAYVKRGDTAKGDLASALTTYGDVLKLEPGCWYAWQARGVVRALQRDVKGAEEDLRQAVTLKGDYVEALMPLAVLFVDSKRYEDGIRLFQRVLDLDATRDQARLGIVEAEVAAGRLDEALATLQPLIAKVPNDPGLRSAKAQILSKKGDHAGAEAIFRQLSREFPDQPGPLRAWRNEIFSQASFDPATALDVLDRLRRVAPSPEEKKAIDAQVEKIRQMMAAQSAPKGPPSAAALATAVRDANPKVRESALLTLLSAPLENLVVEGDLLAALVERLGPAKEPVPANRAYALRAFTKWADPKMAPVIRTALRDPDPVVRCLAADALGGLGNPMGVAALRWLATAPEPEVATSARTALYALARTRGPESDGTPKGAADAFKAWWASPDARDAKIRAIEATIASADLAPDEMVFQFAIDEDAEVAFAAYRGLKALTLVPAAQGTSPKAAWIRSLPAFDDAALAPARLKDVQKALLDWWERRPK